jgi:hypothetical protein
LLYNSALSILVSATLFSILYTSPALIAQWADFLLILPVLCIISFA